MPLVIPMQITTVTGVTFPLVANVGDMSVDRLKQGMPAGVPPTQADTVGVSVTVVSQTGPDGQPGDPGAPGASGGGSGATVDFDGLFATDSTSETVLKPSLCNFGALPSGMVTMVFTARGMTAGGATGTWNLRLGGSDTGVDGTVLATLSVTSSSLATVSASASFTNPNATQVVKLTGASSVEGLDAEIESVVCTFAQG
jgi:hypothetical protein